MKERFKQCSKCKKNLPTTLEYFHKRSDRSLGLSSLCCQCDNMRKREYYVKNKEKELSRYKRYVQTEKGKLVHRKSVKTFLHTESGKKLLRKQRAKRRNLGYNELYPNILDNNEIYEWHHVDDDNIVAIPKDLHLLYPGKSKYHRSMCNEIIKQLYGEI